MTRKKALYGAMLITIAVIIELAAAFSGEVLVIITVFSALPIYLACRIDRLSGVLSYIAVFILLLIINPHQCMFFALLNGLFGLALGITASIFRKKIFSVIISAVALACGIFAIIYVFAIPVFGVALSESMLINILIVLAFCFAYSTLYQLFTGFVFKRLKNLFPADF